MELIPKREIFDKFLNVCNACHLMSEDFDRKGNFVLVQEPHILLRSDIND